MARRELVMHHATRLVMVSGNIPLVKEFMGARYDLFQQLCALQYSCDAIASP